jgi:hypothetical protein
MKKFLSLTVVLLCATGLSVGFRQAMSGTSEASRREPPPERFERTLLLEGAALTPADTGAGEKTDAEYARAAATTGDRLLDRARRTPDNPHLLRQAAAHYRAALAHEPTARNAGDLFSGVRDKLAAIDRMNRPGVAKPTPRPSLPPAVVKVPAPVGAPQPVAETPRRIMFGPDGVEIRQVGPQE